MDEAKAQQCRDTMNAFFQALDDLDKRFQTEIIDVIQEHQRLNQDTRPRKRKKRVAANKKQMQKVDEEDGLDETELRRSNRTAKQKQTRNTKGNQRNRKNQSESNEEEQSGTESQVEPFAHPRLPAIVEEADSNCSSRQSKRKAAKRATELACQQLNQSLSTKLRNPGPSLREKMSETFAIASINEEEPKILNNSSRECVVIVERCSSEFIEKMTGCAEKKASEGPLKKSSVLEHGSDGSIESSVIEAHVVVHRSVVDDTSCSEEIQAAVCPEISPIPKEKVKSLLPISKVSVLKSVVSSETTEIVANELEKTLPSGSDPIVETSKPPTEISENLSSNVAEFKPPAPTRRPCRTRTANKKYDNKDFLSTSLSKAHSVKGGNRANPIVIVTDLTQIDSSVSSRTSEKRKSEENDGNSQKKIKLAVEDKTIGQDQAGDIEEATGVCESAKIPISVEQPESEVNSLFSHQPLNSKDQDAQISTETSSGSSPPSVLKPEMRMTRTRTKDLEKKQALLSQQRIKKVPNSGSSEKEQNHKNLMCVPLIQKMIKSPLKNTINIFSPASKNPKMALMSVTSAQKMKKSPLKNTSNIFSPSSKLVSSMHKKMMLSSKKEGSGLKVHSKEDTASIKRLKLVKAKREDAIRKREEKLQRQQNSKMMIDQKVQERLERLKRENAEKELQVERAKKFKEEQMQLKKLNTEAALKEAEERRIREEQSKQERLKKQEEEKKKKEEERLKMAEEAKKLHASRLAQEAKEKQYQLNLKAAAMVKNVKEKSNEYIMTPGKDEKVPKKCKNDNDYGVSDMDEEDSTDDESKPKKMIPKWARKSLRKESTISQGYIHMDLIDVMFPKYVEMDTLRSFNPRCRNRASSAVWLHSPPVSSKEK